MNPYIDYNLLNWGMAAPTNLNPLNLKLKKAMRIMSFVKDSDYPSAPLFIPNCLSSNFIPNARTQYSKSFSRLESLNRFILFEGPKTWDRLPVNIRDNPSISSFSNSLKSHFINRL